MTLHARISEIEKTINRESDLTVVRVYGGISFGGTIEATFGGKTLQIIEGETLNDFIARAERAAIEARQTYIAITGLQH